MSRAKVERAKPSWPNRVVGATNVGFGVFLILVNFVIPAAGRQALGAAGLNHGVEPNLMVLFAAILIMVAGFEKWRGRREWGLVLAARFTPRSKGDPLVYTLFFVFSWFFWKAFPWVVVLVAPFYTALFLWEAMGSI